VRRRLSAGIAALTVLVGCSGGEDGAESDREPLVVLAASSLTEAFAELEQTYEDDNPDIDVQVSYDSSSVLAQQVLEGAPADVLATADEATMASVTDEGLAGPVPFATNTLTLVTPPDDPGEVSGLADLGSGDVSFATCVPEAPCGQAAEALLSLDGVEATPTTQQENVKAVLTQVLTGQVDAGLVYVTDAQAAGEEVRTVPVDNASEVVNSYPISVLTESEQQEPAQKWVDLVVGRQGQQVLKSDGFGPAAT
jgi:molybdate transport system substrate-binding protein